MYITHQVEKINYFNNEIIAFVFRPNQIGILNPLSISVLNFKIYIFCFSQLLLLEHLFLPDPPYLHGRCPRNLLRLPHVQRLAD